jgi:hypothetical protein
MRSGRIAIEAVPIDGAGVRAIRVVGKKRRALRARVQSCWRCITALECGARALRLAAYTLCREQGIAIRTDRASHPSGRHGRHMLEMSVTIVSDSDDATEAA